jgi:hypothetical protein
MNRENLTYEYIRGLIDGEGCFTFHTVPNKEGGATKKVKIPAFVLIMHERDTELITAIRDFLSIDKDLYHYGPQRKDGYNRGGTVRLLVRDLGTLKNVIIPLFYNNLIGYKGRQFGAWLDKIGADPAVPDQYKLLHRLHRTGFFERNPKFLENDVKREKSPGQKSPKT